MKLYLIEAPVDNAETPYWARTWVASQGEAAATRARYTSTLSVPRKDIRTTAIEVDTRDLPAEGAWSSAFIYQISLKKAG